MLTRNEVKEILEEHGLCLLDFWCDRGLSPCTKGALMNWLGY